jgi:long-chain fatty acid transport protein
MIIAHYPVSRRPRFARQAIALIALPVLLSALAGRARGAALALYETGAPDLGTASAGRAAMAADASTVAANPAGLTLLDRTQLLAAAGVLLPMTNFNVAPETTTRGGGGGNAGVIFPLGSFFLAYKLSDRWRLGIGSYSDFGLSANYGSSWAGRYYVNRESLITMKINPSIAYAFNEWLSLGVGFNAEVGRLTFKSQIRNLLPRAADGSMSFESWDVEGGGNAGILVRPLPKPSSRPHLPVARVFHLRF